MYMYNCLFYSFIYLFVKFQYRVISINQYAKYFDQNCDY